MNTIATVFRKELIDTIRDRRTIMFMVVVPLLLFPILFKVMFTVERSQRQEARAKTLVVACVDGGNAPSFRNRLESMADVRVLPDVPADSVTSFVSRGVLDGAYVFERDFDRKVDEFTAGRLDLYYKSTDDDRILKGRLKDIVDEFEKNLLSIRFQRLELDEKVVDGVELRTHNIASMKEQFGTQAGGFLPYIFIIFCFVGAMYPAIDLGAGEKERGTLETLLTAPVNRLHILIGKFGVIVLSGLLSAIVSVLGMYLGIKQSPDIPAEAFDLIAKILGGQTIAMVFSLLIPLTIFFAGLLLSVSLTARSFKEAQTLITPLNLAVILPAAVGMVPGLTMNYKTAMIPVLNVSLATKEIIAGTIQTGHLIAVYASLGLLALLSLALAATWFSRESTIFRT